MSQQLNLFNPIFLRQKKYFSSRTMVRGMGIVLAGFFLIYILQRVQLAGLEKQRDEVDAQFQSAQQQLTQFAAEGKRVPSKALEDEAESLAAQAGEQEKILHSLDSGELGNATGFSPYLTAFARQTLPGVWLTGFTARGVQGPVSIRGRLLKQELLPTYLRMLSKEDALRGHGFTELQISTREEKSSDRGPGGRYVEFVMGGPKAVKSVEPLANPNAQEFGDHVLQKAKEAAMGGMR